MVLWGHTYNLFGGNQGHFMYDPLSTYIEPISPYGLPVASLGVNLFFSISGYLIANSFIRSNNLPAFIASRILRIYPALIVTITLTVLIVGGVFTSLPIWEYLSSGATWSYFLSNSLLLDNVRFFLPGVFEDLPFAGAVNGSLWSLPLELYFYFLVGVFGYLGLLNKSSLFNGFLLLFFFIANGLGLFEHDLFQKNYIVAAIWSFIFGTFLCVNRESISINKQGILLLLLFSWLSFGSEYYDFVSNFTFTYIVLWFGFLTPFLGIRLDAKGDFSYGVYLYAMPIQQILIHFKVSDYPALLALYAFLLTLCVAVLSWKLVEEPALAKRNELASKLSYLGERIDILRDFIYKKISIRWGSEQ